ncbi:hypothetical protein [Belnapia rosea]|uniref:Uncharacterized protein n=1 Tax=Belnapia rosea TaxID=938405 RepID=A0A1G7ECZ6_9PROT|nr:hypothetical protein [Belnapia rosea]SDE61574.1 hypothetical protein SAMN04487779_10717 [Belnapia rosea]
MQRHGSAAPASAIRCSRSSPVSVRPHARQGPSVQQVEGFAEEARRQSRAVAEADARREDDVMGRIEAVRD